MPGRWSRRSWFAPTPDGVAVRLPEPLREQLADLAEAVIALLPPSVDPLFPPAQAPELPADDAVRRLFPDGYGDPRAPADAATAAASAELRRLTIGDLRATKEADAQALREGAQATALSAEVAEQWARALNDVRLVLGARLGLRADGDAEALEEAGEGGPTLALYGLLGLVQEQLLEALDGRAAPTG